MEQSAAEIYLIYASQTGTARYVAERLNHSLLSNKYSVSLSSIDSFDMTQLPSVNYVIFIVSTIGYGQCPYAMNQFWNFIMREDLPSILEDLNYTIFGLGDSSYEKFNYCSRALDKRLTQLEAHCFFPIGLGDEQHDFGYEGEYEYWSNELISILNKEHFPFHFPIDIDYQCKYRCEQHYAHKEDLTTINRLYDSFKARVSAVEYLTSNDAVKQVVRIQVDLKGKELAYLPGDVLLIYPENSQEDIDFFIEYYHSSYQKNDIISIMHDNSNHMLLRCSVEELFKKYLNVSAMPKRQFCLIASRYTNDETHKEKLLSFGGDSSEGKGAFYYYCHKEKRTFIDFLTDFSSVKLPLHILIQETGYIQPRELSISSSSLEQPNHLELTLGLVDYYTEFKRHKQGLLSKYIVDSIKKVPFEIDINFRKGSFPEVDPKGNVLLIGTGTGIAPIRSFLIERNRNGAQYKKEEIGKTMLLYGCRHKEKDNLYEEALNAISLKNLDINVYYAFSRENKDKEYVQNIILNHSDVFIPFLMNECTVIIVGNSKFLPKAIKMSIIKGLIKEKGINEEEALKVHKSQLEHKMHIESW